MQGDEQEISELVSTWMSATKAGDVETILSLMADDVIFLVPGQPVMRKANFEAAARAQAGHQAPSSRTGLVRRQQAPQAVREDEQ